MAKYFRKVVGTDGTEVYEEVDETDIVESSEAFVKVKESLKKANKQAQRARLEVRQTPREEEEDDEPDQSARTPAPQALDTEALYAQFSERFRSELTTAQTAQQQKRDSLRAIADKFKLKFDEVADVLEESANPEKLAEKLAKTSYRFEDSPAGEDDPQARFAEQVKRIEALVDIPDGTGNFLKQ